MRVQAQATQKRHPAHHVLLKSAPQPFIPAIRKSKTHRAARHHQRQCLGHKLPIQPLRDAPNAPRTAISRRRLSARTSNRLDTFTHAISSSNPAPALQAPAESAGYPRQSHPTSGITLALLPRFESGYCLSSCRNGLHLRHRGATVTPSFNLATPSRSWQLRRVSHPPVGCNGSQNSAMSLGANSKSCGSTPTIV
jgi:hypothetical protein